MDSVTVVNMALTAIGERRISSLSDETTAAEVCSVFFDPTVKYVLEQKAWLFATESVDLGAPQAVTDPVFASRFALPSTVVAVRRVDDGSGLFDLVWERRGEFVYVEAVDVLYATVTQFVADPGKWSPSFCWAVAYKLAATVAGPLTENAAVRAKMEQAFLAELQVAGRLDGLQGSSETMRVVRREGSLSDRR